MVNEINGKPAVQEKPDEERKLTNSELYQQKIKEAAYFRFLSIKEKIGERTSNSYKKGKNNDGLHFSVINGGIFIEDFTQKVAFTQRVTKNSFKTHTITLTFNNEKEEFNLRETRGFDEKNWDNVPIDDVMDFLKQAEDKMKSRHNSMIDNTRLEISNVISGMFSDGKKKRFLG